MTISEQLSIGLHGPLFVIPAWMITVLSALAVFFAVRLYKSSWATVSRTGKRLVLITLALGAAHSILDISRFLSFEESPVPMGITLQLLIRPILEDVMLASGASGLLMRLLRSDGVPSPRIQSGTVPDHSVWKLVCPTCQTVYHLGRDSVIVTADSLHSAAEFSIRIGEGSQPDLVGKRKIESDELADVQATIRRIQRDLEDGHPRHWWCNRCGNEKNPHEYPSPDTD